MPDDLGLIAVGLGPGLFTGMRVGIATGRVLSMALGIPIVGASSLSILAAAAEVADRPVVAVIDARRGEVFWKTFEGGESYLLRPEGIQLGSPGDCAAEIAGLETAVVVGGGVGAYGDEFASRGIAAMGGTSLAHPDAEVLNRLAAAEWQKSTDPPDEEFDDTPIYVRRSDAEINWSSVEREAVSVGEGST